MDASLFGDKEFSDSDLNHVRGEFRKILETFAEEPRNFTINKNFSKFLKNEILQVQEVRKIREYPGNVLFFFDKKYGFHENLFRLATLIEILQYRAKHEISDP